MEICLLSFLRMGAVETMAGNGGLRMTSLLDTDAGTQVKVLGGGGGWNTALPTSLPRNYGEMITRWTGLSLVLIGKQTGIYLCLL